MSDNYLSGKVALDTTNFKANITELNRSLRVIESNFKANAAAMGDWGNSASGLELRIQTLNTAIDVQKRKVFNLQLEYQRMSEKNATPKQMAEQQIQISKATEALNKMQNELGQTKTKLSEMGNAADKAGKDVGDVKKESDQSKNAVNGLKSALGGLKTALSGIGNAAKAAGNGLKSALGGIADLAKKTALAAGVVAAGTVALLGSTVKPASDLNETVSKVGVVFGSAAGGVLKFGDNAAAGLGMSKNAALAAAGTYGNLFASMGIGVDKSAAMSTELVKLAGDLASFNNLDPTDVLDKLRSGLTGETEPLKSLGVNITAAAVKTQALKMGFKETNGELSASAKTQATYALVMQQTTLAQGDFARTSSGAANQQRILAATFEDLKAQIGTGLLPVVNALMNVMTEFLNSSEIQDGIQSLLDGFSGLAPILGGALANVAGFMKTVISIFSLPGGLAGKTSAIMMLVNNMLSGIKNKLPEFVKQGAQMLKELMYGIGSALPALIKSGGEIIQALMNSLAGELPTLLQAGMFIVQQIGTSIGEALPGLGASVGKILESIGTFIGNNIGNILTVGGKIIAGVGASIVAALGGLKDGALKIVEGLKTEIDKAGGLGEIGKNIVTQIGTGITGAVETLKTAFIGLFGGATNVTSGSETSLRTNTSAIVGKIVDFVVEYAPKMVDGAKKLLEELARGIYKAIPGAATTMGEIVGGIGDALAQKAPNIGKAAIEILIQLGTGLKVNLPTINTDVGTVLTGLATLFGGALKNLDAVPLSVIGYIGVGLKNAAKNLAAAAGWVFDELKKAFDGIDKQLGGIGSAIVEGVWKGIQGMSKQFTENITGFFKGIVKSVMDTLGIKSPSTVFAEIGMNMAAGLGVGFTEQIVDVERKVRAATRGLSAGGMNVVLAGTGGSSNTQYSTTNQYAPNYYYYGSQSGSNPKTKRY